MEQKTFYKALVEFNLFPQKAKQYLSDKRLTNAEKKILEAHLFVRNNQNQEAIDLLKSITPSELPFVESHRHFILGIAHNNLSHYTEGEWHLQQSLPYFKSICAHFFIFSTYYDLFIVNSNLTNIPQMKEYLELMQDVDEVTEYQKLRLLKCQFDYYSEAEDFDRAEEVLEIIHQRKNEFAESDIVSHLVCEFMYYVKKEDLRQCQHTLQEMKSYRKFHLTENYNFMKKLLDHLENNAPIYAYDDEFKNIPILFYQLKVIQSFESGDIIHARKFWNKLAEKYPKDYQEDFQYQGNKNLFSLCLNKYTNLKSKQLKPQGESKLEVLVDILKKADSPISKGVIYEMIWGESAVEKDDYNKLTRMIYKARVQFGLDIQTRKGTYFIQEVKEKKKKALG